jgi:hypothetical protein
MPAGIDAAGGRHRGLRPPGGYDGNFPSSGTLVVSGVPEPGSVALVLAGAGVAGRVVRRRV